jgi:hypothetical protein
LNNTYTTLWNGTIINVRLENTLFYKPFSNEYEQSKEIELAKLDLYQICEEKYV